MDEPPQSYGKPSRGITLGDVGHAADQMLRTGERPTTRGIRAKIGTGSPNTIGPLLDRWWASLSGRLDAGPAAFHRLPEAVAQVAESLWILALDESRRRILLEQRAADRVAAMDKERWEVRSHVLTLREGEMDSRLQEKSRTIAALEQQVHALTLALRKEQASRDSACRRLTSVEAELHAAQSKFMAKGMRILAKRSPRPRKPIIRRVRVVTHASAKKSRKARDRR